MDKNISAAQEWVQFAKQDYNTAEFLLKMQPLPIEIICFHYQQFAEKYLKATLVLNGIMPEKTHKLGDLLIVCSQNNPELLAVKDSCIRLSVFAVQTRYSNETPLDEASLQMAKTAAEQVKAKVAECYPNLAFT